MRVFMLVLALLLLAAPANAAFKSESDAISPKEAWNPRPASGDILLPMPCGLNLVLRAVAIPQGALIRDQTFTMGISNAEDRDRQIYERQFPGHIAAPFTTADLPPEWRKKLDSTGTRDSWYFIGKYEISQMQWDAVMNAVNSEGDFAEARCPHPGKGSNLPKTNISWFDAQDFLNKYNAWLIKHYLKYLPAFAGTRNIAFLRLPTEEEWEYAARGGSHVPPEWWTAKNIFPFEEGRELKDYAVASLERSLTSPLAIGSRYPNQLGIHDTAGNVGEMVDGFFRLSVPDLSNGQLIRRLHGAAGGIITKGGGFRGSAENLMPGVREEMPLYTAEGPGRQNDVGLRLALAGINIPSAQRLKELRAEASRNVPENPGKADLGETAIDAVNALLQRADGQLKSDLARLKERIEEREQAQAAEDQKNSVQSLRSLLYQAETLRAFAFRYWAATQQLDRIRAILKKDDLPASERDKATTVLAEWEKDLKGFLQSLRMGAGYYINMLEKLSSLPVKESDAILKQLGQEYGGGTVFDIHMRQNLDTLRAAMKTARQYGARSIDTRSLLKSVLPPNHFKCLRM